MAGVSSIRVTCALPLAVATFVFMDGAPRPSRGAHHEESHRYPEVFVQVAEARTRREDKRSRGLLQR
jgi:hypothetical protein